MVMPDFHARVSVNLHAHTARLDAELNVFGSRHPLIGIVEIFEVGVSHLAKHLWADEDCPGAALIEFVESGGEVAYLAELLRFFLDAPAKRQVVLGLVPQIE